jgi:hypothetical protein
MEADIRNEHPPVIAGLDPAIPLRKPPFLSGITRRFAPAR